MPAPGLASSSARAPRRSLPASLAGTEVDAALRVDASGHLIFGPELRRFFDYYLSARGEESEADLVARIRSDLRSRLPAQAAAEAEALLDHYLHYQELARNLSAEAGSDPAQRLERIRALRREALGPEAADALFGVEEAADQVAVQRRAIEQDSSLTPEEKLARSAALDQQLPAEVKAARDAATEPLRLQQEEDEMRKAGATAEDLYQFRKQTSGDEAAERLAALDQQRAEWNQRLTSFETERDQLRATANSPEAAATAEQQLLEQSFSPTEQLRVRALESMAKTR